MGKIFRTKTDMIEDRATGTKLSDKLSGLDSSLAQMAKHQTNWINVTQSPYNADLTGTTDCTTAVNQAITDVYNSGGGVVYFPFGTYLCLSIQGKDKVSLIGDNATLKKNGGATGTVIVNLNGSVSATSQPLSATSNIGNTVLSVANTSGFSVGDYVIVRDATYKYSTFGRNQEINRISAITANTSITLANITIGTYSSASTAEIVKINPITKAEVKGFNFIIPTGTNGGAIYGIYNVGTIIDKCHVTGANDMPAYRFEQSAKCRILNSSAKDGQNVTSGGYGYGVSLNESCHHCLVQGVYTENVRENNFTNNVRFSSFIGNTDVGSTDSSFNTHGSGNENILIQGNQMTSGYQYGLSIGFSTHNAADKNIVMDSNVISNMGATAISISSPVGKEGEQFQIIGNTITNPCVRLTNNYGILISQAKHISVWNNKVKGANNNVSYGIYSINSAFVDVKANKVDDIPNNYGIGYNTCSDITIDENTISNIYSYNIRSQGTNTNPIVKNNKADDANVSFQSNDRRLGNVWGTKYDDNWGNISLSDGGTITHNLVAIPTNVRVTGSIAGEIVSATAVSASTITVSIKKTDGTAGTTQTIYWNATV